MRFTWRRAGPSGPSQPGSLPAPRYIDQPQHEWPAWAGEFVERMLALGGSAAAINFKLLVTGASRVPKSPSLPAKIKPTWWLCRGTGWESQRVNAAMDVIVRRSGCPVLLICTGSTPELSP